MNTEPLTIEQRSRRSSIEKLGRISPAYELGYEQGAKDQTQAVIDACAKWAEDFNANRGSESVPKIDVESFKSFISNYELGKNQGLNPIK